MSLELTTTGKAELAAPLPPPNVGEILAAVVRGGVTEQNVAAVGEVVKLYERMQAREAEREFNRAFVQLQKELPTIVAETVIPNRGKYARFEDVMKQIAPALERNGFSVAFSNGNTDGKVTETCHLRHVGGHSTSTSFTVRVGRADTEAQADTKAATTAKRKALQDALNIVIRQDCLNDEHDARLEAGPITYAQSDDIERRVKLLNIDAQKFLKWAGAPAFAAISSSRLPQITAWLEQKEKEKAGK